MKRIFLLFALTANAAAAQDMSVPSGVTMVIEEVILEPETGTARFRFVAPTLGSPGAEVADLGPDFEFLCDTAALPSLGRAGIEAQTIVISISDQPTPFGSYDPDVTQYFEGYRIANGACIWEPF